jgi:catechol 2,3-dioxygenase
MNDLRVNDLRSISLNVRDLAASADFYGRVWGLEKVSQDAGSIYFRTTGANHHSLSIHEAPLASLNCVTFAAPDKATVLALHAKALSMGVEVVEAPAELAQVAGGGFGFSLRSPEGHVFRISADVAAHSSAIEDRTRPNRLSHVVINSVDRVQHEAFFSDSLGFRLSDTTDHLTFLRCAKDHHSIALAKAKGSCIHHIAYELPDLDSLLFGAGRVRELGVDMEYGVGRHGPGNNVYSFFIEPNGFASEYTTGMDQIEDEASYVAHDQKWWDSQGLRRPDRWGMVGPRSERLLLATSGKLVNDWNESCTDAISRKMAS